MKTSVEIEVKRSFNEICDFGVSFKVNINNLASMILKIFSNLNDSESMNLISIYYSCFARRLW